MDVTQSLILKYIEHILEVQQDLRVGQLLHIIADGADISNLADEDLLNLLDRYIIKNRLK